MALFTVAMTGRIFSPKSNPGQWAHYCLITLDSTELALFINGNRKAVLTLGSSLGMEFSDDPNLYFGTNPNHPFSMGAKILLDEVRIFDREALRYRDHKALWIRQRRYWHTPSSKWSLPHPTAPLPLNRFSFLRTI